VAKQTATGADRSPDRAAGRRPSNASSDHWKRLLRRAPREPVALDPGAFIDELNRRLRADPSAPEDTQFVLAHDAAGGVIGTTWEGPETMKPVIARIVKSMVGEFETGQPFLFDR
jgi:hypothetical protein